MPKKRGKKKSKSTEGESYVEIISRMEIIYEDPKAVIGAEQEFKWGQIYHVIMEQNVPNVGLEYIPLYDNIKKSGIAKEATRR